MLVIKIDNFDLTRIITINIKTLFEVRSPNRFEIPEIEHSERGAGPLSGDKNYRTVSLQSIVPGHSPGGLLQACYDVAASGREVFWAQGAR